MSKLRKMSEKEKEVMRKHIAAKPHSKSEIAKMRMAVMRSDKAVDTAAKINKMHAKLFGESPQ